MPGAGDGAVRPILKPPSSHKEKPVPRAGLVWDEKNLRENEELKIEMGPRMKIDEPKTPYHDRREGSDGEPEPDFLDVEIPSELQADTLLPSTTMPPLPPSASSFSSPARAKLTSRVISSSIEQAAARRDREWEDGSSDDERVMEPIPEKTVELSEEEQKAKTSKFMEHRKAHYNMGSLLKRKWSDDEEDENSDEGDEGN